MKWGVPDVEFFEEGLEVVVNEVFVNVFEGFVFVVVPDFLSVVWFLIVEEQERDPCTVEPATATDSVSVVSDGGRDVEEYDMAEVWEVEASGCDFGADHDGKLNY